MNISRIRDIEMD